VISDTEISASYGLLQNRLYCSIEILKCRPTLYLPILVVRLFSARRFPSAKQLNSHTEILLSAALSMSMSESLFVLNENVLRLDEDRRQRRSETSV